MNVAAAEAEGRIKTSDLDVITRLKQSIQDLFVDSSGLGEVKRPVIGLADPENGGVYTLIFTNGVCLDLASHTVVIDACVPSDTASRITSHQCCRKGGARNRISANLD